MIIYNVTVNLDPSIETEWLTWMKSHIPTVLKTGKFEKAILTRVLTEHDECTYSTQYKAYSRKDLEAYYNDFAPQLKADALKRFGDKMLAFRTELEIVEEFLA